MKKIMTLLFVLFIFIFIGCSNNSIENTSQEISKNIKDIEAKDKIIEDVKEIAQGYNISKNTTDEIIEEVVVISNNLENKSSQDIKEEIKEVVKKSDLEEEVGIKIETDENDSIIINKSDYNITKDTQTIPCEPQTSINVENEYGELKGEVIGVETFKGEDYCKSKINELYGIEFEAYYYQSINSNKVWVVTQVGGKEVEQSFTIN